jgi:hypothetical protein
VALLFVPAFWLQRNRFPIHMTCLLQHRVLPLFTVTALGMTLLSAPYTGCNMPRSVTGGGLAFWHHGGWMVML